MSERRRDTVEQGAAFLKDMEGIQDQGFHEVNYDKLQQKHLRKASSIINLDHTTCSNEDQFADVDLGRGMQPKKTRLDLNDIFDTPPSVDTKSTEGFKASDDTPSKISSKNSKKRDALGCCGKSNDSSDEIDDDASCTIS